MTTPQQELAQLRGVVGSEAFRAHDLEQPNGLGDAATRGEAGWWGFQPLWKIMESVGMMTFPTEWKNEKMLNQG